MDTSNGPASEKQALRVILFRHHPVAVGLVTILCVSPFQGARSTWVLDARAVMIA